MTISLRRLLLGLATLVILVLTLSPADSEGGVESFSVALRMAGFRGLADSVANILLFAPFGAAAAACFPGWLRPILAGAGLSAGVELVQLFVPGRYSSPWDLLFNTVGAALGAALFRTAARWVSPPAAARRSLAGLALGCGLALLLATPLAFAPAPLPGSLVGQWTHEYPGAPRYEGSVLDASVGGLPVPPWRVPEPDAVREALFRDTVRVRIVAAPPPPQSVPVFAVVARGGETLLELSARDTDLSVWWRTHAHAVGLDQPTLRGRELLAAVAPGDTVALAVWRHGAGFCIAADNRQRCSDGFSPGDGWAALLFPLRWPFQHAAPIAWAAALLFPGGFWIRRSRAGLVAALLAAAAVASAHLFLPLAAAGPAVILAAAAGLLAGSFAGRALHQRLPSRPRSHRSTSEMLRTRNMVP